MTNPTFTARFTDNERAMSNERAVFMLRIAGKPGQAGIHQLRALLKALGRRDFVCLDAREKPPEQHANNQETS